MKKKKTAALPRRYWDSCVFLAALKREPSRIAECDSIIQAARSRELIIVTSSLTLVEVIKLDRAWAIPASDAKKIKEFFEVSWLSVRELDRWIAEIARNLLWKHQGLKYKDAVHVATAIRYNVPLLETYDNEDLLQLDAQVGGTPLLRIRLPRSEKSLSLVLPAGRTSRRLEKV